MLMVPSRLNRAQTLSWNDLDLTQLSELVTATFAIMMYIRVELDFKRNAFRVIGHGLATVLVMLTAFSLIRLTDIGPALSWLLLCSVFLLVNEVIRIYLRKHQMKDILQNHPRLYWLTRGKVRKQDSDDTNL